MLESNGNTKSLEQKLPEEVVSAIQDAAAIPGPDDGESIVLLSIEHLISTLLTRAQLAYQERNMEELFELVSRASRLAVFDKEKATIQRARCQFWLGVICDESNLPERRAEAPLYFLEAIPMSDECIPEAQLLPYFLRKHSGLVDEHIGKNIDSTEKANFIRGMVRSSMDLKKSGAPINNVSFRSDMFLRGPSTDDWRQPSILKWLRSTAGSFSSTKASPLSAQFNASHTVLSDDPRHPNSIASALKGSDMSFSFRHTSQAPSPHLSPPQSSAEPRYQTSRNYSPIAQYNLHRELPEAKPNPVISDRPRVFNSTEKTNEDIATIPDPVKVASFVGIDQFLTEQYGKVYNGSARGPYLPEPVRSSISSILERLAAQDEKFATGNSTTAPDGGFDHDESQRRRDSIAFFQWLFSSMSADGGSATLHDASDPHALAATDEEDEERQPSSDLSAVQPQSLRNQSEAPQLVAHSPLPLASRGARVRQSSILSGQGRPLDRRDCRFCTMRALNEEHGGYTTMSASPERRPSEASRLISDLTYVHSSGESSDSRQSSGAGFVLRSTPTAVTSRGSIQANNGVISSAARRDANARLDSSSGLNLWSNSSGSCRPTQVRRTSSRESVSQEAQIQSNKLQAIKPDLIMSHEVGFPVERNTHPLPQPVEDLATESKPNVTIDPSTTTETQKALLDDMLTQKMPLSRSQDRSDQGGDQIYGSIQEADQQPLAIEPETSTPESQKMSDALMPDNIEERVKISTGRRRSRDSVPAIFTQLPFRDNDVLETLAPKGSRRNSTIPITQSPLHKVTFAENEQKSE